MRLVDRANVAQNEIKNTNGSETVGLDNVVLSSAPQSVPEPSLTLGWLVSGAVGASFRLLRKKVSP